MYGGSTTSILLNIPGEAASVVTCIDGYKMAQKRQGRSGPDHLAVGSFVAGTISILGLMVVALFPVGHRPQVRARRSSSPSASAA